MWQGDAAHSGYLPDTLLLAQRTLAWSKVARPGAITAMVASNTAVFTTDSPTYQYSAGSAATLGAQDLSDGHTLWSISFPSDTVISGPAYADGALFFVENIYQGFNDADTRFLTAVDATTGQQIYRVPLPLVGTTVDTPTISNGHVYLQSQVYPGSYSPSPYSFGSFAEVSGSLEWQSESAGDGTLPTVIGDRIYGCLATLNILDAADGTTLDAVPNPDDTSDACTTKAPAVLGSMAYVNQGDRLAAFDLQAGTVAWSVDHYAAGQISTDGASLFYNSAGALTVRDAATGTLQWGWEAPLGSIGSSGALSDNMVVTKTHVILSDGNKLYFIDRNTHFLVGSYQVAGIVAFASNRVLVGDASGIVTAFHVPTEEIFASGFE
jgi:outer membrane protein assembly factor BamB